MKGLQDTGQREYTGHKVEDMKDTIYRIKDKSTEKLQRGYRIQESGYRIQESGYRIQVSGYRVQKSGHRIHEESGYRIYGR